MGDLSPHFSAWEFDAAGASPAVLADLRFLCRTYLEPARRIWGEALINSGLRTAMHNRQVGGAPRSMHVRLPGRRGAAADVRFKRGTPRDWYRTLDRLGAPGLGLYRTHVHVDTGPPGRRW